MAMKKRTTKKVSSVTKVKRLARTKKPIGKKAGIKVGALPTRKKNARTARLVAAAP